MRKLDELPSKFHLPEYSSHQLDHRPEPAVSKRFAAVPGRLGAPKPVTAYDNSTRLAMRQSRRDVLRARRKFQTATEARGNVHGGLARHSSKANPSAFAPRLPWVRLRAGCSGICRRRPGNAANDPGCAEVR